MFRTKVGGLVQRSAYQFSTQLSFCCSFARYVDFKLTVFIMRQVLNLAIASLMESHKWWNARQLPRVASWKVCPSTWPGGGEAWGRRKWSSSIGRDPKRQSVPFSRLVHHKKKKPSSLLLPHSHLFYLGYEKKLISVQVWVRIVKKKKKGIKWIFRRIRRQMVQNKEKNPDIYTHSVKASSPLHSLTHICK